jgi:hypothetical protein
MFVSRRVAAVLAVALGAGLIGCGSSEGDDKEPVTTPGDTGGGEPLEIYFKTLNTAFVQGSDRKFKVPAVVNGIRADKWECSDKDAVDIDVDGVQNGVMLTARKAGKFTLTATAGKRKGSVPLNITAATEDDYKRGEARYNNAIQLMFQGGNINGIMLRTTCPVRTATAAAPCSWPSSTPRSRRVAIRMTRSRTSSRTA